MTPDNFRFWMALICGVLNMVVSFVVLRKHSTLDNPVIAICVGGLTFIGFMTLPGEMLRLILVSYVALAITLMLLLLLFLLGLAGRNPGRKPDALQQQNRSLTCKDDAKKNITKGLLK